jgi:23S rRNA G2445 N2-methylase RlmL
MQKIVSLLIHCGEGLEDICKDEIELRLKQREIIYYSPPMDGYVLIGFYIENNNLTPLTEFISHLRCFETINLVINTEQISDWSSFKDKSHIEQVIRNFLIETFDILDKIDEKDLIQKCLSYEQSSPISLNEIEFSATLSPMIAKHGINQAMIQAIANRLTRNHQIKIVRSKQNIAQFWYKFLADQQICFFQLNRYPGNLFLNSPHPTGLFPNFAFGLIYAGIQAMKDLNQDYLNSMDIIQVIDPMAGAGTIPILVEQERTFFSQYLGVNPENWHIYGCEKETKFWELAKKNLQKKHLQNIIDLQNIDFNEFTPTSLVNLIITQPPYGYSIPQERVQLEELYKSLFTWSETNSASNSVMSLITPQTDLIKENLSQSEWVLLKEIPIKEHSIQCSIFVLQLQKEN